MWEKNGFLQNKLIQCGSRTLPKQSSRTLNFTGVASLYLHGNSATERSSSRVLEPRWSNLLLGKSCSWEKFRAEVHADGCLLNFSSIQQTHQEHSQISWDYHFKLHCLKNSPKQTLFPIPKGITWGCWMNFPFSSRNLFGPIHKCQYKKLPVC
jgi:hypothetical protein